MIKTIVNKYLKAALSELFINAPSVQLSMGADLFSDSNINLNNLTFRSDIFDVCLQPLKLVSGHLGMLKVEGIAELALGGKLKFNAENCFLLFNIDTTSDAEYLQSLKKILIELQSETFPATLIRELMKRIQGFPIGSELDLKKKRKVMYKALDYVFKGLHGMLKNIHIRIEMKGKTGDLYSAIGLVIPYAKFSPSLGTRPDGVAKIDPLVVLSVKSIQIYADYDRSTYCSKGSSDVNIAKQFVERWSVEVHTSVVLPFDLDIILAVGIRRRIGLLSPKVSCKTPLLRVVCDIRQLEVLRDFVALVAFSTKRGQQLVRVQKIFRKGFPLPRMYEVGGVRLLPHLLIRGKVYPTETTLPSSASSKSDGIVSFMKDRVGDRWATMLWKHLIRLVLHDLRVTRPSGRWFELARLAFIRREYSFMYSKLLKRSKETGHFVMDVNAKMSADKLRQLFEYEMYLPVKAVLMFRVLATMIATAELFNSKRKQAKQASTTKGGSTQPFEKMSIKYKDVLRIFVELFEVSRESASHRFDRRNLNDDEGDIDDAASSRFSEEGSVYAHSIHSRASYNQTDSSSISGEQSSQRASPANVVRGVSKTVSTPTSSTGSSLTNMFSRSHISSSNSFQSPSATTSASAAINNSLRNSVMSVASLPSSAMKMFGGLGGASGGQVDEYDNKLMGKFDLSVFGNIFTMETEDRIRNEPLSNSPTEQQPVNDTLREVFDWQLKGQTPPLSLIAESVQWVLQRHQETLTLMPPDINLAADKITVDLRTPLSLPHSDRRNLISTTITGVSLNATISQSSQNTPGGPEEQGEDDNARKLSSLAGSLIQLRLVAKHVLSVLHLENTGNGDELTSTGTDVKGKGSLLSAGLPAYPISPQTVVTTPQRDAESDAEGSAQEDEEAERDDDASQISSNRQSEVEEEEDPYGNNDVTPLKEMRYTAGISNKAALPTSGLTIKPLAGETVMEAMRRQQAEQLSAVNSDAFKTPVNKRPPPPTPLTIPTSSAKTSTVVEAVNVNPLEREILRSVRSDNALVMCLILDFDDKGEGAADVQVQLGGMGLDLSKAVLSALIVPRISATLSTALAAWSETRQYLPLLSERTLIIDREQKMSAVALAIDAPTRLNPNHKRLEETDETAEFVAKSVGSAAQIPSVAVTNGEDEEDEEEENSVDIEEMYRRQLEDAESIEEGDSSGGDGSENNSLQEQQEHTQPKPVVVKTAAEKARTTKLLLVAHAQDAAHRRAMVENKNIQQWIGITESHMPRVLSICVRTSVITVNMLEAAVLRDLVYSKIHNVIDLAAQRDRNVSSPLTFATDHILGLLGNILLGGNAAFNPYRAVRKWGSKRYPQIDKNMSSVGGGAADLKAVLTIPSTEMVVAKASVPYPCLELHVQGFEMKVPMSDETMCHLSAIVLAELMPFYC